MDPVSRDQSTPAPEVPANIGQSWLEIAVRLRPELKFDVRQQNGRDVYIIEDPVRAKFYQVGKREFDLISQLNGKETVGETLTRINQRLDESSQIGEKAANIIVGWLVQCNLGYSPKSDSLERLERQARAIQNQKLMSLLNPISIKFKIFDPTRFLDATEAGSRWLFSKAFLTLWCVLAVVGLYSLLSNWSELSGSSVGILAEGRWIWMLVIWIALKAVHEWAHGIACRRYGGNVPEAGVLLLLFTPMPFVNVTSSWRFKNRWHRFYVAAAGMYVELFISFVAMIVWASSSHQLTKDICFNIFFLSSVTTVLFNANPLMRFDGYYMLTDLLDVPNLYTKGLKWFGDRLKWVLFGTTKTQDICPRPEMPFVRVYGILAFCWKILISFSLLIAASVMFYGLGLLMAVVAGVLWLGMPVYRFFRNTFAAPVPDYQMKRVVISAVVMLVMLVSGFTILHSPATKSAPAMVQFENEQIIRAHGDGFVKEIRVEDGQYVQQGDVLALLFNDELSTEVANLERLVKESEIKSRIHTKSAELTEAQVELKNRDSLLKKLHEKQQQLENLTVIAPINGYVFQRQLSNRIGEYLHHGDELMTVAQTNSRKIIVSIGQEDLESLQSEELEMMRVVLPGQNVFRAKLDTVNARATDKPTIPAFCASFGGPLAVEPVASTESQDESARYRFLTPRFDVELSVDAETGEQLTSGQVGRAFFDTRQQSLGAYLFIETQKWFSRQFEQAMIGR